jgi:hypothetical protein
MIIGVVGFLGSGKGTVGDIISEKYAFKKMAFADSLKDAVSAIFGWSRHLLEGDTLESREFRDKEDRYWSTRMGRTITPRIVLQQVGSDCMRDVFGKDIWVSSLLAKIMTTTWAKDFVITDCRFPNEIQQIKKLGGKVVRVVRGPEPEWYETARYDNVFTTRKMNQVYPDVHISEWAWIGQEVDYTIYNNSDLFHLESEVTKMLLSFEQEDILHTST